jgi:dTDP-glucose 4,6-dehydratase
MVKTILITGAAGHVGSHICEHILKKTKWNIVVVDRLDYASNGFDRLRDIKVFDDKRVKIFTHDLQQPIMEGLDQEIGHVDYIIHAAAGSHVDNSIIDPVTFIRNNIDNTLNMLEFARKRKGTYEKFIYFSTDEVFGPANDKYKYKEGDRFNPSNPYSASKAAAECICIAYANTYKLPIIITNTMNVLGERQHPEKYFPKIINYILDGKTLQIHANPEKTKAGRRYYIHARNVGDAILFVLKNTDESLNNNDASLGKFNIVGEKELDNLQLAKLVEKAIQKILGKKYKLKYEFTNFHGERPGHDLVYALDNSKLKKLGWTPPKKLEDTVNSIVAWSLKPENLKWLGRDKI